MRLSSRYFFSTIRILDDQELLLAMLELRAAVSRDEHGVALLDGDLLARSHGHHFALESLLSLRAVGQNDATRALLLLGLDSLQKNPIP